MNRKLSESVVNGFIKRLDELRRVSPGTLEALVEHRVPVVDTNDELPFVVRESPDGRLTLGLIGVLNGLLEPTGLVLCVKYDESGSVVGLGHEDRQQRIVVADRPAVGITPEEVARRTRAGARYRKHPKVYARLVAVEWPDDALFHYRPGSNRTVHHGKPVYVFRAVDGTEIRCGDFGSGSGHTPRRVWDARREHLRQNPDSSWADFLMTVPVLKLHFKGRWQVQHTGE